MGEAPNHVVVHQHLQMGHPSSEITGHFGIPPADAFSPRQMCSVFRLPHQLLVPILVPLQKGQGRTKEGGRPLQIGGGKFNQQGNLYTGLPGAATRLVDVQTTCQNLNSLYRGLNWVQSHTPSTEASLLFQAFVFGEAPSGWKASRMPQGNT